MRITILASLILAALTTTVAARARVPRTLLVGLKRQGTETIVIADNNGDCPDTDTQTSCGGAGDGCCGEGTTCKHNDIEPRWTCLLDAEDPGTSDPGTTVEGTEPVPDNNGDCDAGFEYCQTGGCCETTCLAADAEETTYVCEIVQGGVDPEETTSTEDVVSETTAPPPKGNNNPAPTRTPSRSTTSSRSTGSVPTTAPRDGASSLTGKSAAFVAGLVGAMMVLA